MFLLQVRSYVRTIVLSKKSPSKPQCEFETLAAVDFDVRRCLVSQGKKLEATSLQFKPTFFPLLFAFFQCLLSPPPPPPSLPLGPGEARQRERERRRRRQKLERSEGVSLASLLLLLLFHRRVCQSTEKPQGERRRKREGPFMPFVS